jgi:outer membrane lipoprotein-sorting protein
MKTRFLVLPLIAVLCHPALARDEDPKTARAVLDRAIQAAGGTKRLSAKPALTGKSKGTVQLLGKSTAVTNEWTVQGTGQLKWNSELTVNDKATTFTIVLNGDEGWIAANNGKGNELQKVQLAAFREGVRGLRLAESLVPLTAKEYTLSSLGELKVNGKAAVGIKAKKKGAADVDVWFDKKTHLPLKAEMHFKDGSEEATWTAYFSEYKKIDGRQHFTKLKVQRDAKTVLEVERSDIKASDKLDDDTFAKP